jgi:PAS domain S-box-containing protein
MEPVVQPPKNNSSYPSSESQQLIAEMKARADQLAGKLLVANARLAREVAQRRRLEEKFRSLLALTPQAIIIVNKRGRIVLVNSQTEQLFGYSRDEVLGWPVENLLPEHLRNQYRQHRASYTARRGPIRPPDAGLDLLGRHKDGREFPIEVSLNPLTSGEGLLFLVAVHDLTQRRQEEDNSRRSSEQLRELSARLQSVREEERTRIARAIHDELGQSLTGLKMDVAWLQGHFEQPALLAKTQAMSELIDITVQAVRRIATELRPGILDLSLVATIEWQLQEFQTRTGIESTLISAPGETMLDADGATTVFRIFQEILTNVVRHAHATKVEVVLEETAAFLTLQVHDNGRGITESEIHSPKSIGLLGMQERARLRAGEVKFQGTPGKGTTVTIRLPLAMNNE